MKKIKEFRDQAAAYLKEHPFSMKIRYKMLIANVMMILIPALVALGLFVVFFDGARSGYWEEIMETILKDKYETLSAESILRSCSHEEAIGEMRRELSKTGYHFRIEKDGNVMYSNLKSEDVSAGKAVVGSLYKGTADFTVTKGRTVVMRISFRDHGHSYATTAIRTPSIAAESGQYKRDSYIKKYIEWFIGIMLVILIAVIVLLNLLMYRWISRRIIRPLGELSDGTERIREGDLDFEMKTDRKDEIGTVINDFDDMREYLQDSVEARLRYEESRTEMIRGISHDLRTPLTSIRGYVEGLRDGIANTPEKQEKYYKAIEVSISNLERLTADLTDFSRIESGRTHLYPEKTELNEYYQDEVKELREKYLIDNVTIRLNEWKEPLFASIDRGEMKRIHSNLIDNTVKYRSSDASEVVITLERDGKDALIRFADDGPGAPEKDLENVFECFFRGDAARTEPGRGSGIGLAVVRQIVEGLGGTVRARNENGFVVEIRLPAEGEETDGQKDTDR
ncbi:MAG: sensor histidine kinase [Anaerovoracaceae bacterium]|jgi:signal transduction histidine kinase